MSSAPALGVQPQKCPSLKLCKRRRNGRQRRLPVLHGPCLSRLSLKRPYQSVHRSLRYRFRVEATSELDRARRTFRRFREFARSKDAKRTESELQSYSQEMQKLRGDLLREIEDWRAEGTMPSVVSRHLLPVAWEVIDSFYKHAQRLFQKSKDGYEITNSDVRHSPLDVLDVRAIFGLCDATLEVVKTVAISLAVIIGMRQFGADIFENFKSPVYGWRIDWLLWTFPYAFGTYFFWNSAISRKWDPLKGFKFSTCYQCFRGFIMKNPRSYHDSVLLIRSLHSAWLTTVYQGLGFYLFESLYPFLYGADFYSLGFSMTSPLPSIVWLPVELLFLGSVSGVFHVVTGPSISSFSTSTSLQNFLSCGDWSLMVAAEDVLADRRRFFTMDARIAAKNVLEFNLLNDPRVSSCIKSYAFLRMGLVQISRDRATVTFLYYFMSVGYLSIEAIFVHSLFASMGTLAIGHYLTYKGMQKSSV